MRTLLIVLGVVFGLARPVGAKPKVAIIAFDNDKKNEAREMVSDTIGDDVTVLGSKQVNRTIDDLGFDATSLDDKALRKLSKELEADAIIQAKLSTKGKDKILHFKLWVHNKKAKGFKVEFGSLKSDRFKQQLHDKLLERLGYATAPSGDDDSAAVTPITKTKSKPTPAGDDDSAPVPSKSKTKAVPIGDDDDAPTKKPSKTKPKSGDDDDDAKAKPDATTSKHVAHAGDDDDDSGSVTAKVEVTPASEPSGPHTANRDAVRVDIGPSASQRTLSFNSRSFAEAPSGDKNGLVGGARVQAEIYPFAFSNPDGGASGIGAYGYYDQAIASNVSTSIQPGTKFPVTQRHYEGGLRYRILFGHHETSPTLAVGIGYGHREFVVNRGALMPGNTLDLPDVNYRGFIPSLAFRLPLTPRLALSFGVGALLLTGAGPIQTQAEYGQATVTGVEGDFGFDILFTRRIGMKFEFDAAQIGYKFKGNGEMTNDRDGDPSTQDVGGAADRYLGGALTLVVLY
jgi:TolB-like protein